MFVELIIIIISSLWAQEEKGMSSEITNSARAMRQNSKGLVRGLRSTLRHIFCIGKVFSGVVCHDICQDVSSLIPPPQCQGI